MAVKNRGAKCNFKCRNCYDSIFVWIRLYIYCFCLATSSFFPSLFLSLSLSLYLSLYLSISLYLSLSLYISLSLSLSLSFFPPATVYDMKWSRFAHYHGCNDAEKGRGKRRREREGQEGQVSGGRDENQSCLTTINKLEKQSSCKRRILWSTVTRNRSEECSTFNCYSPYFPWTIQYTVHWVYRVHYTRYTMHYTVYSVYSIVYSTHYTLYTMHYTVYTI